MYPVPASACENPRWVCWWTVLSAKRSKVGIDGIQGPPVVWVLVWWTAPPGLPAHPEASGSAGRLKSGSRSALALSRRRREAHSPAQLLLLVKEPVPCERYVGIAPSLRGSVLSPTSSPRCALLRRCSPPPVEACFPPPHHHPRPSSPTLPTGSWPCQPGPLCLFPYGLWPSSHSCIQSAHLHCVKHLREAGPWVSG